MVARFSLLLSVVALAILATGCNRESAAQDSGAAPEMPGGWTVVTDTVVGPARLPSLEGTLDADLVSVRNTVYEVEGKRVQLNTIRAATPNAAKRAVTVLQRMKSEQAILRKGATVYEFVGPNEVLPLIRAGRAHLAR